MTENRTKETAWRVLEQIRADNGDPQQQGLEHLNETAAKNIFELFWEAQFDDDRDALRVKVDQLVDIILGAEAADES